MKWKVCIKSRRASALPLVALNGKTKRMTAPICSYYKQYTNRLSTKWQKNSSKSVCHRGEAVEMRYEKLNKELFFLFYSVLQVEMSIFVGRKNTLDVKSDWLKNMECSSDNIGNMVSLWHADGFRAKEMSKYSVGDCHRGRTCEATGLSKTTIKIIPREWQRIEVPYYLLLEEMSLLRGRHKETTCASRPGLLRKLSASGLCG